MALRDWEAARVHQHQRLKLYAALLLPLDEGVRHPKYFYHRSSLVSQKEEADAVESVAAPEVVDCCIAEEVCTDPSEGSKRRLLLASSGLVFLEVVLWRIRCNLWNSYHPDSHRMPTGLSVAGEARSPRGVHGRSLGFVLEGTE